MKVCLLAFVVAAFPATPFAQNLTGNEVLNACVDKNDSTLEAFCTGYIKGVIEGLKWGSALPALLDKQTAEEAELASSRLVGFCIPEEATLQQDIDIVIQYLQKNPQDRQGSARFLVQLALDEAFPCKP